MALLPCCANSEKKLFKSVAQDLELVHNVGCEFEKKILILEKAVKKYGEISSLKVTISDIHNLL